MNDSLKNTITMLDDKLFEITDKRVAKDAKNKALKKLHKYEFTQKSNFLGYQVNEKIDYKKNYSDYPPAGGKGNRVQHSFNTAL